MNNCEIVSNVACGKEFQYCRTHKVEPHNCPRSADSIAESIFHVTEMVKRPDDDAPHAFQYAINAAAAAMAPQKRDFMVGDKVRVKSGAPYSNTYASYGFRIGDVATVIGANPLDGTLVEVQPPLPCNWTFYIEPDWLEHV